MKKIFFCFFLLIAFIGVGSYVIASTILSPDFFSSTPSGHSQDWESTATISTNSSLADKNTHDDSNSLNQNSRISNPASSTVQRATSNDSSLYSEADPDTLSDDLKAWWFVKNEDHLIPSAQEEINLQAYDAWYVQPTQKEGAKPIFLTFDCGYENGLTPSFLDLLKKHHATACFFLCQHFIEDQPDLVKRMKEDGHVVGNHTVHHISMPGHSTEKITEEITGCASYMKEATGYEMDPFFRPPKGEYSERTLQITRQLGYTTVFWSMAYVDYDVDNQPGADYVKDQFRKYVHPGAIPLIHNISSSNAEAFDDVLTELEQEGYTFESLYALR